MTPLFRLDAIPSRTDIALLVLRLSLGLSMLILHGLPKLSKISESPLVFADPFGVGARASLIMALFAEVVCAGLLIVGLCGRLAAAILAFTMGVAFFVVHKGSPSEGELAMIYMLGFLVLFIGGTGALALDNVWGVKGKKDTSGTTGA